MCISTWGKTDVYAKVWERTCGRDKMEAERGKVQYIYTYIYLSIYMRQETHRERNVYVGVENAGVFICIYIYVYVNVGEIRRTVRKIVGAKEKGAKVREREKVERNTCVYGNICECTCTFIYMCVRENDTERRKVWEQGRSRQSATEKKHTQIEYVRVKICWWVYICTRTCIRICLLFVHVHAYVYVFFLYNSVRVCACMSAYLRMHEVCIYMLYHRCVYIHIHIFIDLSVHTYMYIHVQI